MDIESLQKYREARKDEFENFLNNPHLLAVLNRLLGMLTKKSSKKLTLRLTADEGSYTDGSTVTLGMPYYFFVPQYGPADWTIIYKTELVHEVEHINSSCFRDIKAIRSWFSKLMEPKGIPQNVAAEVAQNMLNIFEDGRIENIAIHHLPGFKLPFLLLNGEIRHYCGVEAAASEPAQEYHDFIGECLSYAKTGRHAPGMEVYAGSEMERVFSKNMHYIDECIDARTSANGAKCCRKFLIACADYLANLLKDEGAQQEASKDQDEPDEYTSNGDMPNPGNPSSSSSTSASGGSASGVHGSPSSENDDEEEGKAGESKGQPGKTATGKGKKAGQNALRSNKDNRLERGEDWTDDFSGACPEPLNLNPLTPAEMQQLRRGVRDEYEADDKASAKAAPSKRSKTLEHIEEFYKNESCRRFQESHPIVSDSEAPLEIRAASKRMEKTFKRIILQKNSEQRHLRHGRLDVRSLPKTRMGNSNTFWKPGTPVSGELVVGMAIDDSGSMESNGATLRDSSGKLMTFSKSCLARSAASMLEGSFQNIAPLKITLFDVSGGTIRHQTLKDFDEKTKGGKTFASIQELGTGCGNKDGYSIRVMTNDLLARRERKKVLVILSDGLPSDYNGGSQAGMEDVRAAVKEARHHGVIVIPIMFGDASFREQSKEDFAYMYDKFISCDPISIDDEFEKLFIKLVKHS